LAKARECSRLTLPGLIPAEGVSEHSMTVQPYSSVGAQLVANLTARLLLSLFPVEVPFFQYRITPEMIARIRATSQHPKGPDEEIVTVSQNIAELGYAIHDLMDESTLRQTLAEAIRHLLTGGNVLVYIAPDRSARIYRLDQYVVRRDNFGRPLNIIVKEAVYPSQLSQEIREACRLTAPLSATENRVDLYTVVAFQDGKAVQFEELNGHEVPGSRGEIAADDCGWLPLRWRAIAGNDYGEGHVGDYVSDLITHDQLYGIGTQSTAAAARAVFFIDPMSNITLQQWANASHGDALYGRADAVTTVQLDKSQDLTICRDTLQDIERRLSDAFLRKGSTIRDAERVTAAEIRVISEELESTLGGIFTTLSAELQLPLVRRFQYLGAKAGVIPKLSDDIKPRISTGMSALGKTASATAIRSWVGDGVGMFGPQAVQYINVETVLRNLGLAASVENLESMLLSADERAAAQQDAQIGAMAQAAAPAIVNQIGAANQQQP
jgi:hypothetical protein